MAKVQVAFSVDLGKLAPGALDGAADQQAAAEQTIRALLFDYARGHALQELRTAQRNGDLTKDQKAEEMARALRRSMLTLQAEANMDVSILPEDTFLSTEHPVERVA